MITNKPAPPRLGQPKVLPYTAVEILVSESLQTVLDLGISTPEDFLMLIPYEEIMEGFRDRHDLRAKLLYETLRIPYMTGLSMRHEVAATVLRCAAAPEPLMPVENIGPDVSASDIVGVIDVKDAARYIAPRQRLWQFVVLHHWWSSDGDEDSPGRKCMEKLLTTLLETRMITKRMLVNQIGIPLFVGCLIRKAPKVACVLLTRALGLGDDSLPTGADVILEIATVKVITMCVPLEHLYDKVLHPAAMAAGLVVGSPAATEPAHVTICGPDASPPDSRAERDEAAMQDLLRKVHPSKFATVPSSDSDPPVEPPAVPRAAATPLPMATADPSRKDDMVLNFVDEVAK